MHAVIKNYCSTVDRAAINYFYFSCSHGINCKQSFRVYWLMLLFYSCSIVFFPDILTGLQTQLRLRPELEK